MFPNDAPEQATTIDDTDEAVRVEPPPSEDQTSLSNLRKENSVATKSDAERTDSSQMFNSVMGSMVEGISNDQTNTAVG